MFDFRYSRVMLKFSCLAVCSVTFDNTPVPVENVIGGLGEGFKVSIWYLYCVFSLFSILIQHTYTFNGPFSAPHSRQITMPAPHHSVFYRPDALPAAQPTALKHWTKIVITYASSQIIAEMMYVQYRQTICTWTTRLLLEHSMLKYVIVCGLWRAWNPQARQRWTKCDW